MPWPKGRKHTPEMIAKAAQARIKYHLPEAEIVERLLLSDATTRSLALEFGCSDSTIKVIFRKHTTKTQRLEAKWRKQGMSLRGYKHSDETRRKNSEAHRGELNHFLGKKHDPLSRALMSVRKKGKTTSMKQRVAISAYYQGIDVAEWQEFKTPELERLRRQPKYINWRTAIFKRDDYTCQLCHKRGGRLQAHHIKRFSKYPELRYEISNGVTLCKECHLSIAGKEEEYEHKFG